MNAFILSQFSYCPVIWMFHDRSMHNNINKIHERALRIAFKDMSSKFEDLLMKAASVAIHQRNLTLLTTEIYKTKHDLNPKSSLKKLKDVLPQSKLCDVYHALFESHIRYGDVVWGTISSSELQALQSLQNRALSIIDRTRFQDLWPKKWLSVMNLIRFDRCVMVYKIVNKQCPESLWNMFQQRCSISNYNTRNYRDLHIPKLNLELTKKGFH